jgi:dsRNA-specific ribonuclease
MEIYKLVHDLEVIVNKRLGPLGDGCLDIVMKYLLRIYARTSSLQVSKLRRI